MIRKIKNSSGKFTGEIEFTENKIIVNNSKKPTLEITDRRILDVASNKNPDVESVLIMYDEYTMCVGEIACVFDVCYSNINKIILNSNPKTKKHNGRRNRSYGKPASEHTKNTIRVKYTGSKIYNNGEREIFVAQGQQPPEGFKLGRLPFSEHHRQKIREAALSGKYLSPSQISRRGWEKGKFDNVNFKHGIGGYITSQKIEKRFMFRSLLELDFIINYLEVDDSVKTYKYEPLRIHCEDGSLYTPDFLVNNKEVIELKSYKYVYKQGGKIKEKFEYKKQCAEKYCKENGFIYKVVFDEDIGFKSDVFRHWIWNHKDIIQKYQVEFFQPERVWSPKVTGWQKTALG